MSSLTLTKITQGVWQDLAKPIICLAPMEDVTGTVFRQLLCELGKPPLMFSEFVNVHQIYSHADGSRHRRLQYQDREQPLILQIWGLDPNLYYNTAQLAADLGYVGVDINMGCPQPKITKKGACSAMIDNPVLAGEIIEATLEGAAGRLPVSVKTRIGFKTVVTADWVSFLLQYPLAALTIHGRTAAQMSRVPADWTEIQKAVEIRDRLKSQTLVIGNGDVLSLQQANQYVDQYKVDGVMIARGIFQNPWLFAADGERERSKQERIYALLRHLELWQEYGNGVYSPLKRFFKIYISDFENSSELRTKLMETKTVPQARQLLKLELEQDSRSD